MKISKSKQELARIISKNGGWRDVADWSVCGHGCAGTKDSEFVVSFFCSGTKPSRFGENYWSVGNGDSDYLGDDSSIHVGSLIKNWHQTILSRAEYFHLYPAPDAVAEEPEHVWTNPPTIEQLAAEYRNRHDYAERKQQEADEAKAEAETKLSELIAAGRAVGLAVSVGAPESELVITDWRDLQVGDEISVQHMKNVYSKSEVLVVGDSEVAVRNHAGARKTVNLDAVDWKFIRRP